jgi:hypothetical protein
MTNQGTKIIYVRVKANLHDTLKRMCIATGLTQGQIISQYLAYLRKKQHIAQWVLTEKTQDDKFQLDTDI